MARGVQNGDRVGIWAPNCPEWTIVQYATAKIGGILVNVNPAYRTHELAYVLEQSGACTLIAATAFKSSDYCSMVAEVRSATPQLSDVVFLGTDDWQQTRLWREGSDHGPTTSASSWTTRMFSVERCRRRLVAQ
jgi:fatty-acyl-CoA synthase